MSLLVLHSISLPPGVYGGDRSSSSSPTGSTGTRIPTSRRSAGCRCRRTSSCGAAASCCSSSPASERAWHGPLGGRGRENCNDYSLGIELEGLEGEPFEARSTTRWHGSAPALARAIRSRRSSARARRALASTIPVRASTGRCCTRPLRWTRRLGLSDSCNTTQQQRRRLSWTTARARPTAARIRRSSGDARIRAGTLAVVLGRPRDPRYSVLSCYLSCASSKRRAPHRSTVCETAATSLHARASPHAPRRPRPNHSIRPPRGVVELPVAFMLAMTIETPPPTNTGESMQADPCSAVRAGRRHAAPSTSAAASAYQGYQIIRRNGAVVVLRAEQDRRGADEGLPGRARHAGGRVGQRARDGRRADRSVVRALLRSRPGGGTFHIEDVQDQVELGLMRGGHHEVARAYVLYRERRAQERARQGRAVPAEPALHVTDNGQRVPLDLGKPAGAGGIGLRRPGRRRQRPSRCWPRPSATCTTACRSARSQGGHPGRPRTLIEKDPATRAPPRGCCCTPSAARSWARR